VRLFAAIDLPTEITASLTKVVPADDRMRLVPAAQWHVTLAFYGEVDEPRADKLREVLERAALRSRPFRLRLAGAGTFPKQAAKARVLWIGLDGEVEELRRLADRCAGAGRRSRIAMEDRAFRAHLTLGRSRREPVDASHLLAALSSYSSQWWNVTTMRLVRSHLGSEVRHETLDEYELGAESGKSDNVE